MISLTFTLNKEPMNFTVENRIIHYRDRFWKNGLQCIPKDEGFVKKIVMSRNKIPAQLVAMFNLSPKDKAQYDNAKDDNELADIIIKDAELKGLILIKDSRMVK